MKKPSLSDRWHRIRNEFELFDLFADALGKTLIGFSIGVYVGIGLSARASTYDITPLFVLMMPLGAGVALVVSVKVKFWKRFWE